MAAAPVPSDPPAPARDEAPWPVGRVAFVITAVALLAGAGDTAGVRDAGELTAAAAGLDVPHPTGFVADMVGMRLAMLLPFGDAGFRANVYVALVMALAAALGARLVYASSRGLARVARVLPCAIPPVVLLTSPSSLRAGTAAEVYALALTASLAAMSLLHCDDERAGRATRQAALLTGATLLLHTGARPAAVIALAVLLARAGRSALARLGPVIALGATGALGVMYLPLAARRGGVIDWGDPSSPSRLVAHLTAQRIRSAFADRILVPWRMPDDLAHAASVLAQDLGPLVLVLTVLGALVGVRYRSVRWLVVAALVDLAYAVAINPMGIGDRQTLFFFEAASSVLAAFALTRAARKLPSRAGAMASAGGAMVLLAMACARFDGRHAARADGWAEADILGGTGALGEVPVRAIVLCESDDLCGGSLYAQGVEGERPDVTVLPRQHLADASTWRRLHRATLGRARPEPGANDAAALRVARLRALLAAFPTRVRWEQGETEDERLVGTSFGTGETPVLAVPGGAVRDDDAHALAWLAPRLADGVGAHAIAADVLFAVGRRLATLDLDRGAPAWRAALALDPDLAPAYTNLGVVRARAGDLDGAIALARRATELDPERLVAWRNLARYLHARGDEPGAARAEASYAAHGGR